MRRLGGLLAVGLGIAAFAIPATASASSTVFGDDLTHSPFFSNSALSVTTVTNPDGTDFTGSPVGGVLVSVRVKTSGGGGSGVVRVLTQVDRPDANTYVFRNIAPEIPITVTPDAGSGHITEVLTRHTISAGDRLALRFDDAGGSIRETWNDPGGPAQCAYAGTAHPTGSDIAYTTVGCNNNPILAQGTVESDADHDGYGDETQDRCPTNASTQGPCPTPPPPHKKKCKKHKRKHRSAEAAKKKCRKKRA
jgi:hypothetical protein